MAAHRRIILIRNERNEGFVVSVNRGIKAAGGRDVVLLNSDTEVPLSWLGRLTAQAYASPRIATVSPLSNNATICTYPGKPGSLIPFGHTLGDIDEVCQRVNAGRWVDAPTTVGFCMYIRRKALRQVGAFDVERFTFGYGEENDFCLRAATLGWRHRIACDTFVYHQGSVSFGNRAQKLSERAMTLIMERYPNYQRDVARHIVLGEIIPFQFAVSAALFRQSRLPVILMVTHDLGDGIRRHIDSLVERLQDRAHILLLEATRRGATLSVPSLPHHPTLTLPAERLDDLVLLLQSMAGVSRAHSQPAGHGYGYSLADPPGGRAVRHVSARLLFGLSADQSAALAAQPVLWNARCRGLQHLHREPKFSWRDGYRYLEGRAGLATQGG